MKGLRPFPKWCFIEWHFPGASRALLIVPISRLIDEAVTGAPEGAVSSEELFKNQPFFISTDCLLLRSHFKRVIQFVGYKI